MEQSEFVRLDFGEQYAFWRSTTVILKAVHCDPILPTFGKVDIHNFVRRGARDFLLLSYKGMDSAMHLSPTQCAMFDDSVSRMLNRYGSDVAFKVDVCWGSRLKKSPQLLYDGRDCHANDEFISISSDIR